jgi:hypothetical protein
VSPDDEAPEAETAQLPPDEAAKTLFGLLQAPSPQLAADGSAPQPSVAARFTPDHVRRLQSVLQELRECRRVIDAAMIGAAA